MEDLFFLKEKLHIMTENQEILDEELLNLLKTNVLELILNSIKCEKECDQIQSIIDRIEGCEECDECDDE